MADWFWSRPYLLLTFTALFWAGNSIVGRAVRDILPPAAFAFWRWAFALFICSSIAALSCWDQQRRAFISTSCP
ncbi:hypothetical protein [Altererythrobacter palmitatis]|uniref:hypothetical protein n=1 Tax=Alteraurantiacibacter palmitatis TaxID=2054628 RepID=UPI00301B50BD